MKGFVCTDLDKNADWPNGTTGLFRAYVNKLISERSIYLWKLKELGIKPDKKTRQWWAKHVMSGSWFTMHMYAHHIMRQIVNHVDEGGVVNDYMFTQLGCIENMRRITNECAWKPQKQKELV
jgi:hypothetical protein